MVFHFKQALTALSHDGGVFPQHGGRRLRQGDDDLQRQLPLHVGQVGVCTQLRTDRQTGVSQRSRIVFSSAIVTVTPAAPTHLQAELQRGLQVGSQVFGCRVCDFHQRLEHRVVALVAGVVHRLVKQKVT